MLTKWTNVVVLLGLALSSVAMAQSYKKLANQAAEALEDAESKARRAGGPCRAAVVSAIDAATDHVYDLRKGGRGRDVQAVKFELSTIASNASMSGCPAVVLENVQRALELVEEVRVNQWSEHRGRRGDDEDEPQPRPHQAPQGFVQLAPLVVQPNDRFENEPAVRVSVPELRLTGMQGQQFYLGARFRSYEGEWSDWVTTQQWSVPSDPFIWKNAFNHYFRASTLAQDDFSDGRFVARVSVFDASTGQELASREATFKTRLPQLPPASPPPLEPPSGPPGQPERDCGTGPDVGCSLSRAGQWPMDGVTFNNALQNLRGTPNEALRLQVCQAVFQRSTVTAIQFGMVLDMFENDLLRMSAAQVGVGRVVNPQHALGYGSKWANPAMQAQYTAIVSAQMQVLGGNTVPPPVGGGYVPPPPSPGPGSVPPMQRRDCGTGSDPGCTMVRNGAWAMDGMAFQGVVAALRANPNELLRRDMVATVFESNAVTAIQLGILLDQFNNELTRLEVAKLAAEHVVNPLHALGLASKFRNGLLARDFTQVMASQH